MQASSVPSMVGVHVVRFQCGVGDPSQAPEHATTTCARMSASASTLRMAELNALGAYSEPFLYCATELLLRGRRRGPTPGRGPCQVSNEGLGKLEGLDGAGISNTHGLSGLPAKVSSCSIHHGKVTRLPGSPTRRRPLPSLLRRRLSPACPSRLQAFGNANQR